MFGRNVHGGFGEVSRIFFVKRVSVVWLSEWAEFGRASNSEWVPICIFDRIPPRRRVACKHTKPMTVVDVVCHFFVVV